MIPAPIQAIGPPPWVPMLLPPVSPVDTPFWQSDCVYDQLRKLQESISMMKKMRKELKTILLLKGTNAELDKVLRNPQLSSNYQEGKNASKDAFDEMMDGMSVEPSFLQLIKEKKIDLVAQESLTLGAANSLLYTLKSQLAPFSIITCDSGLWEEKSAAVRLSNKQLKSKRNKHWKKKKRKYVAEMRLKELGMYDEIDKAADEWRAREIAKDIARRKVERMKEIARIKAEEEKKRLESELELVLIVEKLQELRSIRIQKLKKQGHFLPEEDDKFLEQVRAAVEEEERQAAAALNTEATKEAIATAEESRKASMSNKNDVSSSTDGSKGNAMEAEKSRSEPSVAAAGSQSERQVSGWEYNIVSNLPAEFYHYYYGSSTDMGTLIEVRRAWDAFIRPGGSRIAGHWVQPPPPADEIWASYLVSRRK